MTSRRLSLGAKFFWTALLNLMVLAGLLLVFVRHQLGQEFQSFLMATAREKIVGVSRQVSLDLAEHTHPDAILARYSRSYGMTFVLFDGAGKRMAGPEMALPEAVANRVTLRSPIPPPIPPPTGVPPPFLIEAGEPPRYWIGVRTRMPGPEGPNSVRATLLLVTETLFTNPFFFEWQPWAAILATAVAVTLLCWFPLVHGLTRDIGRMKSATAEIAEGRFDAKVDAKRGDELGALGAAINQMAARLSAYLHGQKRFLGDAAHEIRSPLGRMQVALGILERKSEPEAQEYVRDLQEDVEFLSGLTTELLTFARSEMRPEPIVTKPLPLKALAERAVQMEAEGAEIRVDIDESLTAMAEESLLLRALSNLVRNAVRYAGEGGPIDVSASKQEDRVVLIVADRGPGVPEAAMGKLFTPFFRLDSARERKKGGTGLGLAIVRSCVEACGGTVHAENREGGGLAMVIRLMA